MASLGFFLLRFQIARSRSNTDRPLSICPLTAVLHSARQGPEGVWVHHKNNTNRMYTTHTYAYICNVYIYVYLSVWREWERFKESAHIVMEASKPKVCRLEPQGELLLQNPSEGHRLDKFLLLGGSQPSVLVWPRTDWMRPIQIMEGNMLFPKSTVIKVNIIQKHPHRNIQNHIWLNVWPLWSSQVDT